MPPRARQGPERALRCGWPWGEHLEPVASDRLGDGALLAWDACGGPSSVLSCVSSPSKAQAAAALGKAHSRPYRTNQIKPVARCALLPGPARCPPRPGWGSGPLRVGVGAFRGCLPLAGSKPPAPGRGPGLRYRPLGSASSLPWLESACALALHTGLAAHRGDQSTAVAAPEGAEGAGPRGAAPQGSPSAIPFSFPQGDRPASGRPPTPIAQPLESARLAPGRLRCAATPASRAGAHARPRHGAGFADPRGCQAPADPGTRDRNAR